MPEIKVCNTLLDYLFWNNFKMMAFEPFNAKIDCVNTQHYDNRNSIFILHFIGAVIPN